MSDLKPCPFCGGVPLMESHGAFGLCIRCSSCGAMFSSKATPGRLDVAWNRRAERTCTLRHVRWDDGQCTWGCKCSACGDRFEHETGECWNYCPYCGSRIERGGE